MELIFWPKIDLSLNLIPIELEMNHNYSFHLFITVSYVKLLRNATALIPIRTYRQGQREWWAQTLWVVRRKNRRLQVRVRLRCLEIERDRNSPDCLRKNTIVKAKNPKLSKNTLEQQNKKRHNSGKSWGRGVQPRVSENCFLFFQCFFLQSSNSSMQLNIS